MLGHRRNNVTPPMTTTTKPSAFADNRNTAPRSPRPLIDVRPATIHDLPFIRSLQAEYSNQLGFLSDTALHQYITSQSITIAEYAGRPAAYLAGRPALKWQPLLRPITQIATLPIYHGRGLAAALIRNHTAAAITAGQLGLQAICRATLPANHLFQAMHFKHICFLAPGSARKQPLIVWRLVLARTIPLWMAAPPKRAGHRAKRAIEAQRKGVHHAHHRHADYVFPPFGQPAAATPQETQTRHATRNAKRKSREEATRKTQHHRV
jgi:N-acetylglutamate synthase-like GNAT family acetyltransferase